MNFPLDSSDSIVYLAARGVWLVIPMALALGAAVGSFLNVVAYRLPRGMSLSRPGSQCPACGRPIRWYDNVPVFGWLWLGGRCRDCRAAISPRYPLVELTVAVATAVVACWAMGPLVGDDAHETFAFHWLMAAFRLVPLYALICAGLLEFDGYRGPWRLSVATVAAGGIAATIWPGLRPAALGGESAWRGLYDGGWMLAAALAAGGLAWPLVVERADRPALGIGAARVVLLAVPAVFLGTTALAAIAVFSTACFLATRVAGRFWRPAARFGWAAALALGTLIWIVQGPEMAARLPAAFRDDPRTTLLAAGAIVAMLASAGRAVLWAVGPGGTDVRGRQDGSV